MKSCGQRDRMVITMNFNDREKIIQLTPLWKGERFPNGRPKVADKHLDALYGMR